MLAEYFEDRVRAVYSQIRKPFSTHDSRADNLPHESRCVMYPIRNSLCCSINDGSDGLHK